MTFLSGICLSVEWKKLFKLKEVYPFGQGRFPLPGFQQEPALATSSKTAYPGGGWRGGDERTESRR
jgi:hypothetical protein